jgi:hypothetical protein
MTTHEQARSTEYERVRQAFEDLGVEDKAVFLLEATVTTIARTVETAGRLLADEIDRLFRSDPFAPPAEPAAEAPGPAEPESAPRARSGKKDAGPASEGAAGV